MPRFLVLFPTTKCNARCKHCWHGQRDFGQDLAEDVRVKVEEEIFPHLERVQLVGYGEPLLYKHFNRLVRKAIDHGIAVTTCTYGAMLDETKARLLVENGAVLQVSIDGASARTFNNIRPTIDFDKVMSRLEMLDRIRRELDNPRFALQFNCVITRSNLHEMSQMVELARRYRAHLSLFNLFVDTVAEGFAVESALEDVEGIHRHMGPAIALARDHDVPISVPEPYLSIATGRPNSFDASVSSFSMWRHKHKGQRIADQAKPFVKALLLTLGRMNVFPQSCQDPYILSVVSEDGSVYTCCLANELSKIGSLRENSFAEIWNGANYRSFRERLKTNDPPRVCQRCNLVEGISKGNSEFFDNYKKLGFLSRWRFNTKRVLRGEI